MRSRCRSLAVALLACAMGTIRAAESPPAPDLKDLLAGMDRASRLYLDAALRFTCDETISQVIDRRLQTGHYQYIFVYDERQGFKDYRMKAGRGDRPPADPARAGFRILQRSYFWVLSFHAKRQEMHRYAIAGEETLSGMPVVLLHFEPIPPYQEGINDWFGTVWVDPATFQILKVEAMRADYKALWDRMQEDQQAREGGEVGDAAKIYTIQRVSTEFKALKNGMRFPSRSRVVQSRYELPMNAAQVSKATEDETVQTYRNYRFYGVRTAEEVRSLLKGERDDAR